LSALGSYKNLRIGNYQAGVAYLMAQKGVALVGADLYYDCTVPFGSGLSSSAAIEVATAVALYELSNTPYDKVETAVLCQRAENKYVGMNCGVMDQFASAMGKKGHAVLLDCATLAYEYVPLELGEYTLVVANCNKPHNLVESKYNERRAEVEKALGILQKIKPWEHLAELSVEEFEEAKGCLSEPLIRRAKHVVYECDRVKKAVEALKKGDIQTLGKLLNESHYSLRDLYEVTGKELDTLSALAREKDGCLGSRMIGGGFGGCTISIVKKSVAEEFIRAVDEEYEREIGYKASFYQTSIEDGITVEKL
jgi:galactokinase